MLDRSVLRYHGQPLTTHADLSSVAMFHCNDMVVDSAGRAYVGNFGWDLFTDGLEGFTPAHLARVDPDGAVSVAAEDLAFPNGMVFANDGTVLVVAETMGQGFRAYDVDSEGNLSNHRRWAALEGAVPDGCDIDSEAGIWYADARGNKVVRVLEGGEVTDTIDVGTGAFACCLGGDDGKTLFVMSAPSSNPEEIAGKALGKVLTTQVAVAKAS
jgi:sugar lactone lactonase YvrE